MAIDPHFPPAAEFPPREDFRSGGWRSVASLGFLGAAFLLFVGFHVLSGFGEVAGWTVWPELWGLPYDLKSLNAQSSVVIAAFLSFSFLILVSPFLGSVWRKSGWALWGTRIFSGLSGAAFWLMYCVSNTGIGVNPPGAGGWCLLAAPLFNLVGLLLAGPGGSRSHGQDPVGPGSR